MGMCIRLSLFLVLLLFPNLASLRTPVLFLRLEALLQAPDTNTCSPFLGVLVVPGA